MTDADTLWVFGYGSLVWRPAFPFAEKRPARLRGFARRFWQGSTDHRGVPGAPGRVVTLVPDDGAVTDGMAYRVAAADVDAVLARLDHREKGGYDRLRVPLTLRDPDGLVEGLVYRATETNPNYLGPAPATEMAATIRAAVGPSGPNDEYLLRLRDALRKLGVSDPHVEELACLVER